jgi:hypothetical protein
VVALLLLMGTFSSGFSQISGGTNCIVGETYTYSFPACSGQYLAVSNGTVIYEESGLALIRWTGTGSGSISVCSNYLSVGISCNISSVSFDYPSKHITGCGLRVGSSYTPVLTTREVGGCGNQYYYRYGASYSPSSNDVCHTFMDFSLGIPLCETFVSACVQSSYACSSCAY